MCLCDNIGLVALLLLGWELRASSITVLCVQAVMILSPLLFMPSLYSHSNSKNFYITCLISKRRLWAPMQSQTSPLGTDAHVDFRCVQSSKFKVKPETWHSTKICSRYTERVPCMFKDFCALICKSFDDELWAVDGGVMAFKVGFF